MSKTAHFHARYFTIWWTSGLCGGRQEKKTEVHAQPVHEFFIIYSVSCKMDTKLRVAKKGPSLPILIFRVNARVLSSNKDTPPHFRGGVFMSAALESFYLFLSG